MNKRKLIAILIVVLFMAAFVFRVTYKAKQISAKENEMKYHSSVADYIPK